MKCQRLFPGRKKKNVTKLSSAEVAQRVVKVNLSQDTFTVTAMEKNVSLQIFQLQHIKRSLIAYAGN